MVYLPPQIDLSKHIYSGSLTISVGNLVSLNKPKSDQFKVKVVFWGQEKIVSDQVILRLLESQLDLENSHQFTICVDRKNFERYLQESKRVYLHLIDNRNDTLIGSSEYILNSFGQKLCSIKRKQELIGSIQITIQLSWDEQVEQDDNWSKSYQSNEFKQDPQVIKRIESIANSIQNIPIDYQNQNNQLISKENDIDDEQMEIMFQQILKKGQEIQEKFLDNFEIQNIKSQFHPIKIVEDPSRKPFTPEFPELQSLSNEIDMIKIKSSEKTSKKKIEEVILNDHLGKLRLENFFFTNQNAFQYMQNMQIYLQCDLPNLSKCELHPKMKEEFQFNFQQDLPFDIDIQDMNMMKLFISFKLINFDDKREFGSAKFDLNTLKEFSKSRYVISFTSQVPFDRINNYPISEQSQGQILQKINSIQQIGELHLSLLQNLPKTVNINPIQLRSINDQIKQNFVAEMLQCLLHIKNPRFNSKDIYIRYIPFQLPIINQKLGSKYTTILPVPQKRPPFLLLEFWNSDDLIGIFKIDFPQNLSTSSLYGLVIKDGETSIQNILGQIKGSLDILLVIGNVLQINNYQEKQRNEEVAAQIYLEEAKNKEIILQQQLEQQIMIQNNLHMQEILQKQKQEEQQEEKELLEITQITKQIQFDPEQEIQQRINKLNQYRDLSRSEGNLLQMLIEFFEEIRRNQEKLNSKINNMLTTSEIFTSENFIEYLKSFQIDLSDGKIGQLLTLFDNNQTHGNFSILEIELKEFGQSYSAFFKYEGAIRDNYELLFRECQQLLGNSKSIKQLFNSCKDLFIDKEVFKKILLKKHLDISQIESFSTLLALPDKQDLIFYPQFWEYPKQFELHGELKQLQANYRVFVEYYGLTTVFCPQPLKQEKTLDIADIQNMLKQQKLPASKFDALILLNAIDQSMLSDLLVESIDLQGYMENRVNILKSNDPPKKRIKQDILVSKVFSIKENMDDIDEIQNFLNDKGPQQHDSSVSGLLPQKHNKSNSDFEDFNDYQDKSLQEITQSNLAKTTLQQSKQAIKNPLELKLKNESQIRKIETKIEDFNYINHYFKVKILKIYDYPYQQIEDPYVIQFQFPTFDKTVESLHFSLCNKTDSVIYCKSKHLVTLSKKEKLCSYFLNLTKGIQILLVKKYPQQKTAAQTLIPIYDILDLLEKIDYQNFTTNKNKQMSRYVLYDIQNNQNHFGIIQVSLSYHCEPSFSSVIMQKEFQIQKMLPKNGRISIKFKNVHYLKEHPRQPFFTCVRCDFFHSSRGLPNLVIKTDRIKNDAQYELNFYYGHDIQLNEQILDYFKNSSALIQLIAETDYKTIILGSTKVPLIEIITNYNGIEGDLPIFSDENVFVGSIGTHLSYDEKPLHQEAQSKIQSGHLIVSINSILNHIQITPSFAKENKNKSLMYFSWNYQDIRYCTQTFILQNDQQEIQLNELYQIMTLNNLDSIKQNNELEIKLFVKEKETDELFAFMKINLFELLQQNQTRYQNYFTCIKAENSKILNLRVGLIFKCFQTSNLELEEQNKHLLNLIQTPEKEYSHTLIMKAKQIGFQQSDFNFTNLKKIMNIKEYNQFLKIQKDLSFYDFDNQGLIDFEDAKRVLIQYEDQFDSKIDSGLLSTFQFNNSVDSLAYYYHLNDCIDLLQLFNNLQAVKVPKINPESQFKVTVLKGLSFQNLNNNIPPNSFISINQQRTQIKTRQQNPIFDEQFIIKGRHCEIQVGHSMYSRTSDSIRQETFLAIVPLQLSLGQHRVQINSKHLQSPAFLEILVENHEILNQDILQDQTPNRNNNINVNTNKNLNINQDNNIENYLNTNIVKNNDNGQNRYQQILKKDDQAEEDLTLVYQNIERTLREINQKNMKADNIKEINPFNITEQQELFSSTLEQLSKLNLDLDDNLQSFGMMTIDKPRVSQKIQNPFQQQMKDDANVQFPVLQKSLSFKKLEDKLKKSDQQELDRIASIMREDLSKSMRLYELSSDSD